jgi:hypothetical protein
LSIFFNLDGLQYIYYDFSNHPLFVAIFQQSTGKRNITFEIPYTPSIEMPVKKNATIYFTEMCYNQTSQNITLKSNYISSNETHVFMNVLTEDDISWITLRGYVAIYSLEPSNVFLKD